MTESSDHRPIEPDSSNPRHIETHSTPKLAMFFFGLAAVTMIGFLLFFPAINGGPAAPRTECMNNLRNIALSLRQYHDEYGSFPPAYIADEQGRPMHSWRVLMLPYLERPDLYRAYRFDEPWNGPNNRKLARVTIKVFGCVSDNHNEPGITNYVAIVGPKTAWRGSQPVRLGDIKDELSNTILLVEVANSDFNWLEPRDLEYDKLPLQINPAEGLGISSHHKGGAYAAFCDGEMNFLKDDLPPETLRRLLKINDGEYGEYGEY